MKPTSSPENDEPIIVLVLFALAGLCVIGGLVIAVDNPIQGIATAIVSGSSLWAVAVTIRILHRIERNTRR